MVSLYFKNWIVVSNLLRLIEHSICLIQERTSMIAAPDDFASSLSGMEKLDAVCMQLIAIGESVKKLDKLLEEKLAEYEPTIPWQSIKSVRNFIAHDYFDIDVEEIYHIIKYDLQPLLEAVRRLQAMQTGYVN